MRVEQYATLDGASDIWDVQRLESTVFPSSVTSPLLLLLFDGAHLSAQPHNQTNTSCEKKTNKQKRNPKQTKVDLKYAVTWLWCGMSFRHVHFCNKF